MTPGNQRDILPPLLASQPAIGNNLLKTTRFGFARAPSLRAVSVFQLLIAATLALGAGTAGHYLHVRGAANVTVTASAAALSANPAYAAAMQALVNARDGVAAVAVQPVRTTREAELDDGQNFAELLADSGVPEAEAMAATTALSKIYDMRRLKAGQNVTLSFLRSAREERFIGAVFQPEATRQISIARTEQGGFAANVTMIPVTHQRFATQGEIRSSLYEASDRARVPHAIMASLIRIYSHDIDFQRDIHSSDRFEILYEQSVTAQGKAVGEGEIIYAAMMVGGKVKPVYRVTFSDKSIDYFDERGQSVRRALLRTPVAAARITSGFGMRMHPLLGYSKMHKGVDFGAPIGAPIFAAGNGVIEDVGFRSGYGRYIRIRHGGGLATAYAHMSRFGAKIYRGARVNQGEVIGYVGMSGRATGPHLHFEVLAGGQQVNPMSVNLPAGRALTGALLAEFKKGQLRVKQEFAAIAGTTMAGTDKVASGNLIKASAAAPAFAAKPVATCGKRGC